MLGHVEGPQRQFSPCALQELVECVGHGYVVEARVLAAHHLVERAKTSFFNRLSSTSSGILSSLRSSSRTLRVMDASSVEIRQNDVAHARPFAPRR